MKSLTARLGWLLFALSPATTLSGAEWLREAVNRRADTFHLLAVCNRENFERINQWQATYRLVQWNSSIDEEVRAIVHFAFDRRAESLKVEFLPEDGTLNERHIAVQTPSEFLSFRPQETYPRLKDDPDGSLFDPFASKVVKRLSAGEAEKIKTIGTVVDPRIFFSSGSELLFYEHLEGFERETRKGTPLKSELYRSGDQQQIKFVINYNPSYAMKSRDITVFSAEYSYLPVEHEFYFNHEQDKHPSTTIRWQYVKKGGIWIPQDYNFILLKKESGELDLRRRLTLVSSTLNAPIPDSVFTLASFDLKQGDRVADEIDQELKIFRDNHLLDPSDYEQASLAASTTPVVGILVGLVIVVTVVILFRVTRTKRSGAA